MTSAVRDEPRAELQVLQAQRAGIKPLQPRPRLIFAARLFEIFGQRFAKTIRTQLGTVQPLFNQVHRTFFEIQKRLEQGVTGYSEIECGETLQIIEANRVESQGDLAFFADLKEMSYGILPFPQKIITFYKNPELDTLARIEAVRSRAFYAMLRWLKIEPVEDQKGVEPSQPPKPLTAEEEMAVTKLLYGGGAIVYEKRVIYFSEMVEMWRNLGQLNEQRVQSLLSQVSAREWGATAPNPVMAFLKYSGTSFSKFNIFCSIDAAQKNLGLDFSPPLAVVMETKFENEQTRSDFIYFSAVPPSFYETDFSKFNRDSARLIRPFQLYFFITRNFVVEEGVRDSLLLTLVHMDPRWYSNSLPNFDQRRWQHPPLPPADVDAFNKSWSGFQRILQGIKPDISLTHPSDEDVVLLKKPECWDLLFFLWLHPRREAFIETLVKLSKIPQFSMTLESALAFCRENNESCRPELPNFFPENYGDAVQALLTEGVDVQHSEHILFDPPLAIAQGTMSIKLGIAGASAKRFVALMQDYPIPRRREFCLMLRNFIFHPHSLMFDLLKDVPAIGAEPSLPLLCEALSKHHEPFDPEPIPSPQTRGRAVEFTRKIQDVYHFSDVQIFSIYLEMIRLVMRHEEAVIWKFSQIVHELVAFCPAVLKKDIYFLFRYHPNMPVVEPPVDDSVPAPPLAPPSPLVSVVPEHVASLAQLRDKWAKNEAQLTRFVIDQGFYNRVIERIERFVVPLSKVCMEENIGNKFDNTMQSSLLSAFFPPFQPLMDYFRITNVTELGAKWGEPSWRGHLGQLKFILGEANIGIYLNWSILKGRPVLFISFFDIKTREAYSAFVPLDIQVAEIAPNRAVFYPFLFAVSSQVLREKAEKSVPMESPETPSSWIPAFSALSETLDVYSGDIESGTIKQEHVDKMWIFFRKVKLAYRNLFLSKVANRRLPDFDSYQPTAVAALGHIFSCHPRGSLLPKALFQLEQHPEYFIPDATEEFVDASRTLFAEATNKLELLNLELNMPDGKHPISYQVQTADQVTGEIEHRKERNDTAPPIEMVQGRYVTLSAKGVSVPLRYPPEALENPTIFRRYFDYHNLLLKSAVYNS